MIRDELESFDRRRHGRVCEFSINVTKLWRRIWGQKKSEIDERLKQARRDQVAYEAMFAKPSSTEYEREKP